MSQGTFPAGIIPSGYQKLTVDDTARALTVPAGSIRALVIIETQPVRYRDDGTDPSTTDGMLVAAGASFEIRSAEALASIRLIRSTGSSGTAHISYYRE